jgi:uncharacterized protein YjcR
MIISFLFPRHNSRMAKYSNEIKEAARALYIKRWLPKDIAVELNIPPRTVYHWADVGQWAGLLPAESIEDSIARRVNLLTNREKKTALELEELRDLVAADVKLKGQRNKHAEKMAEIQARNVVAYDGDAGGGEPGERRKGKYKKNDVSAITPEMLDTWAREHLFDYQLHCRDHKDEDWRFILKSRQVGMTYYFAWEAFEDAVTSGDNQVFFSASRAQSEIFREYIVQIAQQHFGVTLTGKNIRLSNGAVLRFLSTNASTAQGFNGHLYGDEVFWIPKFTRLHEVASAMATHNKFRTTYFSTPSAKTHQAYPVWTGEVWREDDAKRKTKVFPGEKAMRQGGIRCPDDIWRYIITMEDAIEGGLGALVSIERLRNKYNATAFAMLYMCQFVDSKDAVFKLAALVACEVDPGTWGDYDPTAVRPFGNREVWAGFDPSRSGDNSTFVIVAPPIHDGERFRVLAIYQWQGLNFSWQAEQIKPASVAVFTTWSANLHPAKPTPFYTASKVKTGWS